MSRIHPECLDPVPYDRRQPPMSSFEKSQMKTVEEEDDDEKDDYVDEDSDEGYSE